MGGSMHYEVSVMTEDEGRRWRARCTCGWWSTGAYLLATAAQSVAVAHLRIVHGRSKPKAAA